MNELYNYAAIMADIACHIDKEILESIREERIAFNAKTVTKDINKGSETITFLETEVPDINKNDERFDISHTVTIARYREGGTNYDEYSYVESINLLINGNLAANFMHVASPEVFEAARENYELFKDRQ